MKMKLASLSLMVAFLAVSAFAQTTGFDGDFAAITYIECF